MLVSMKKSGNTVLSKLVDAKVESIIRNVFKNDWFDVECEFKDDMFIFTFKKFSRMYKAPDNKWFGDRERIKRSIITVRKSLLLSIKGSIVDELDMLDKSYNLKKIMEYDGVYYDISTESKLHGVCLDILRAILPDRSKLYLDSEPDGKVIDDLNTIKDHRLRRYAIDCNEIYEKNYKIWAAAMKDITDGFETTNTLNGKKAAELIMDGFAGDDKPRIIHLAN